MKYEDKNLIEGDGGIIEGWGGKCAEDTSHIRDLSGMSGEDNSI